LAYFVLVNGSVAFGASPSTTQSVFAEANLQTGTLTRFVDLSNIGGTIVTNDLDKDSSGNWYITDSAGGRVIKVIISSLLFFSIFFHYINVFVGGHK